jgi:hypothetical protein
MAKTTTAKSAKAKKRARTRPRKKAISRTQEGELSLPETVRQDLALAELRDRILIELAALDEFDGADARPYKMVLVVKRTRKTPLSYKLVVERTG